MTDACGSKSDSGSGIAVKVRRCFGRMSPRRGNRTSTPLSTSFSSPSLDSLNVSANASAARRRQIMLESMRN